MPPPPYKKSGPPPRPAPKQFERSSVVGIKPEGWEVIQPNFSCSEGEDLHAIAKAHFNNSEHVVIRTFTDGYGKLGCLVAVPPIRAPKKKDKKK